MQSQVPQEGAIGFYRPDPGSPTKSPSVVLAVEPGRVKVKELPTDLDFSIDIGDWMPFDEMVRETSALAKPGCDAEVRMGTEFVQRVLGERFVAMSRAAAYLAERLATNEAAVEKLVPVALADDAAALSRDETPELDDDDSYTVFEIDTSP